MGIKFAENIIKEIEKRGTIAVPDGYVTGEAYEEWLYEDVDICSDEIIQKNDLANHSRYKVNMVYYLIESLYC